MGEPASLVACAAAWAETTVTGLAAAPGEVTPGTGTMVMVDGMAVTMAGFAAA